MPGLLQSLKGKDLGHLNIVAELWGVEITTSDVKAAQTDLINKITEPVLLSEIVAELPEKAHTALDNLLKSGGKMAFDQFTRMYGELREMGPGRRDREQPYLNKNASAVEALWYRALVGRVFKASPAGPQEFAYVPDEFIQLLGQTSLILLPLPGILANPQDYAVQFQVNDWILDDACTLLAGLRQELPREIIEQSLWYCHPDMVNRSLTYEVLIALLTASSLIDNNKKPEIERIRVFLEENRGKALLTLFENWKLSSWFNDLKLIPGLIFEGTWINFPDQTRKFILEILDRFSNSRLDLQDRSAQSWLSMQSFISWIKQNHPDFQRASGEFDSWYIRSSDESGFLRGFENWNKVEGKLIEFVVGYILHALGIMDVAAQKTTAPDRDMAVTAFRFSKWSSYLLNHQPPSDLTPENDKVMIRSDARISASRETPRSARYQLARFCQWNGLDDGIYHYEITPLSLNVARSQGLRIEQFIALLKRFSSGVPASIIKALNNWDTNDGQVRFSAHTVLRVTHPEVLEMLWHSRAARFLGDPLGPTAVIVKPGARDKLITFLKEQGYLAEIDPD